MADSERTAQEREAARVERERRRAGAAEMDGDGAAPDGDGAELPIGTRRIARSERPKEKSRLVRQKKGRRAPRALRRPTPPQHRAPKADTSPRRHRRLIGGVVALAPLVVIAWFLIELFQPFQGAEHGSVTVTIPARSGAKQIGDLLAREGVVPSGFFFDVRSLLAGDRSKLRAGTYTLKLDMSYSQALRTLTTAPPAAKVTNLTLIEGRSRQQIDALLRSQHISGSYLAATRGSPLLQPWRYGAPRSTPSLEGFLFPSTYQLRTPVSISALVADQLKTFRSRFAAVNLSYATRRHLTAYDVLIIASLVQAEAQVPGDFPRVASVIYNRLADHMPLQLDSTTRYATGNYTTPLTESQLNSRSPYNTRNHTGLTPTPIDNPGMEAIQAAAHPDNTNYLFFVVKPCGNGASAFASTYKQFQAEVAQYYSARAKHGGNSPAHC